MNDVPKLRHSIQTVAEDSSKCPLKGEQATNDIDEEDEAVPPVGRPTGRRPSLAESIQYMTKSVSK